MPITNMKKNMDSLRASLTLPRGSKQNQGLLVILGGEIFENAHYCLHLWHLLLI